MNNNDNPFEVYSSGAEMWQDSITTHGLVEAFAIGRNYLDMNLKRDLSKDEEQFAASFLLQCLLPRLTE